MDILANLAIGFANVLQPVNFLMIVLGLLIGIIAGALPGITMINSIVLVLPFTYVMGIVPAVLLMIGVYCGGVFGGSITGILFNIPGDPMNVPTTWEGYRLNRQGKTQYALGLAIMSSAFGGLVSALCLAFFAPPFAKFALGFSTVEFFSVVVFGLASVSVLGSSSMTAALISLFVGMFLGTIGTEAQYGVERFTFGIPFLITGVDFVAVLIGLFAIGEVIEQLVAVDAAPVPDASVKGAVPRLPLLDLWPLRWSLIRGTAVGLAVGGLAGAGATVSSFVSYGLEKQVSKTPELFGKGHEGGLVASESSVNGSTGGAMVHLLCLGVKLRRVADIPARDHQPGQPQDLLPAVPAVKAQQHIAAHGHVQLGLRVSPGQHFQRKHRIVAPAQRGLLHLPAADAQRRDSPLRFQCTEARAHLHPGAAGGGGGLLEGGKSRRHHHHSVRAHPGSGGAQIVQVAVVGRVKGAAVQQEPHFSRSA